MFQYGKHYINKTKIKVQILTLHLPKPTVRDWHVNNIKCYTGYNTKRSRS